MEKGNQEVNFADCICAKLLEKAVRNLEIVYQPIWNIESETVIGYEALCRPYARDPTSFIERARVRNRTTTVDMAIIRRAIVNGQCLIRSGQRLFLNVEPETMKDTMLWLPWRYEIPSDSVVLEITERADAEGIVPSVFRHIGVHLAIDDAGTAWGSLGAIERIKPDYIKMDRQFLQEHHTDGVLRGMVHLAKTVNANLVAEGVETVGDLEFLRSIGVRYAQGYFLGRPSSVETWIFNLKTKIEAPR